MIADIVEWWKSHEFLYNYKKTKYCDREKKDRVIRAQAVKLGCSAVDLRAKMQTLRSDLGRIIKPKPTGSGQEKKMDPTTLKGETKKKYDMLEFLVPYYKPKKHHSTTKVVIYIITKQILII